MEAERPRRPSVEAENPSLPSYAVVPEGFTLRVLAAVFPLRFRLSCAAVCRAWRALVADPLLWQHLRLCLSPDEGGDFCTDAVLRAACARAGSLLSLDITGCSKISHEATLEVVAAHAATLRELHGVGPLSGALVLLCRAAFCARQRITAAASLRSALLVWGHGEH